MKNKIELAEEVLALAVSEGTVSPIDASNFTETDLLEWYDKELSSDTTEATEPF